LQLPYVYVERQIHAMPRELDQGVAWLTLETIGIRIDQLTPGQERYLASWKE